MSAPYVPSHFSFLAVTGEDLDLEFAKIATAISEGTAGPPGPPGPPGPSYATRSAAEAAAITAPVQSIVTGGYAAAGDGGDAQYARAISLTTGGFQSADGAFWSYVVNGAARLEQFGGKADFNPSNNTWTTDNSSAFTTAYAVVTANFIPSFAFYAAGPTIEFLYGSYYFGQTIALSKTVAVLGKGQGVNGGAGSAVYFAKDRDGFLLNNFTTGPNSPGSAGTTIRGLSINAMPGGVTGHGINMQSRGYLYDLVIVGFVGGDGEHIDSTLSPGGNVDGWVSSNVRIVRCKNGHVTIGSDANAGNAYGLDVTTCTVTGISDQSFLGNNYWGCQVAACGLYAYEATNANAQNQFHACYVEGGQTCNVNAPAIIWGGFLAFNTTHIGSAVRIYSGSNQALNVIGAINLSRTGYSIILNPTTSGLANLTATGDANPWEFPQFTAAFNSWQINRPGKAGLFMTTSLSNISITGSPIPVPAGNFLFGAGLYIGNSSGSLPLARFHDTDSAAATTGLHIKGAIRYNNTPVPGGNVGWGVMTTGAVATVAWAASTAYAVGALALNDSGKSYICTTAGTSASSGGPTGTGTGIADGTAVWSFQAAFATTPFGNYVLENTSAYAGETIGAGAVGAISSGVTLTGAALGDFVDASLNADQQGTILNAWVSATNTVKYQFVNPAGAAGSVTLAANTVKLRVRK